MIKLTSDRYSFTVDDTPTGMIAVLLNTDNKRTKQFLLAGQQDLQRVRDHMASLTDEQCDQWLDPERIELLKQAAKEADKIQRARFAKEAAEAKQAKVDKKLKNKHNQQKNVNETVQ
jgi:ABC-type transport system substrate-binding protein